MRKTKIALFEGKKIRRHWDEEKELWYFSVVDVVRVLTNSIDAGAYWRKLKQRLKEEGSEVVTKCHELKFMANDGKYYASDAADTEAILRLIQSIPSPNAEPFKLWLTMHTYHAASYNETFEQLLEPVAINVAEPYYQYFSGFYTIDTLEGGYLLMTMNPKTLIGETVYKFSVADGDRFAVGKVFGNRLVEIVATWVPSGPIEHKYYDLKNKKFLPLKFVEAVTLADDKLYFLQENATPFNIYYYYGDEVDRGGYPNQLRVIDLNDYKISDLYTADFGYLRVKELKPRQIILQENMFDKNVELNYQSTKAEISKVFLGQKDVMIDY